MVTGNGNELAPARNRTSVERRSDRELVIVRTFNGPPRIVFEAMANPELFKRWFAPKSLGVSVFSHEADERDRQSCSVTRTKRPPFPHGG